MSDNVQLDLCLVISNVVISNVVPRIPALEADLRKTFGGSNNDVLV